MFRPFLLSIVLASVLFSNAFAQVDPLRSELDDIFSSINKTSISTNYLEEYAIPLIPLDVFNGNLTDSNKVNIDAWRMAYATLYSSRINGVNSIPSLLTINSTLGEDDSTGADIQVPIFYGTYNFIRADAITANLLTISGNRFYDVPGRPVSPYSERQLFIASPTRNFTTNGQISLVFKSSLYYTNSGKSISSIMVDFDNGAGYMPITWDIPISAVYLSDGVKRLKIKLIFSDATQVECYSVMEVAGTGAATHRYDLPHDYWQRFQDFSTYGGGDIYVRYSRRGTERTMTKPLIVLEGFDISTIAGVLQENYSFDDFLSAIDEPLGAYDFNNALDDVGGYDLVFVDYGNGAQDIKKNALLLRTVINWVNAQKAAAGSVEQNVVMGISMGGLVARYCLADMTKSGLNPQTRLLITHDSPHRGANLPVGLQFLVKGIANMPVGIPGLALKNLSRPLDAAVRVLDAPASNQMLITKGNFSYNALGTPSYSFDANTFLESEYRPMITFLPSHIQPTYQVRATSLGSECGTPAAAPGAQIVSIAGNFYKDFVPWIVRRGSKIEISANTLPAYGTSGRVMALKQTWTYRILGIPINITRHNVNVYSPNNMLPWDIAPGGIQTPATQVGNLPSVDFDMGLILNLSLNNTLGTNFCFVPTVSALDVEDINAVTLMGRYNGGATPGNLTRVAGFVTNNTVDPITNIILNGAHPAFTGRNARWIFNQMENINEPLLNCNTGCLSTQGAIEGTFLSGACSGATATFSIKGFPAGSTYTWLSDGGVSVTTGQGTSQITGTRIGSSASTLTLQVTTPCGTYTFTKNIAAIPTGPLGGTIIYYNPSTSQTVHMPASNINGVCAEGEVYFDTDYLATVTNVVQTNSNFPSGGWYWIGPGGSTSIRFISDYVQNNQWPVFDITYSYGCGTATQTVYFWEDGCTPNFMVSPNPASGQLTVKAIEVISGNSQAKASLPNARQSITAKPTKKIPTTSLIRQVILVDLNGRELIRKIISPTNAYTLDISSIQAGMYFIRIYDGAKWSVHKVIIR